MDFNDKELGLIIDYNYDPEKVTLEQLTEVKNKELNKAINFLKLYEGNYYKKKNEIDKVDPSYFPEVVDFEINRLREYLVNIKPEKLPIDFFQNYFKKSLIQVNKKMEFELAARLQYIQMINLLKGRVQ